MIKQKVENPFYFTQHIPNKQSTTTTTSRIKHTIIICKTYLRYFMLSTDRILTPVSSSFPPSLLLYLEFCSFQIVARFSSFNFCSFQVVARFSFFSEMGSFSKFITILKEHWTQYEAQERTDLTNFELPCTFFMNNYA